jgi:hypothetical protein
MKLAVFGGTGYVGQALVRMAVDKGYELQLLVRDPSKFSARGPGVEVMTGDALDIAAVTKTVAGCAAVLSTLGGYHGTPSLDDGTANILAAMRASNIDWWPCRDFTSRSRATRTTWGSTSSAPFYTCVARRLSGDPAPSGSCCSGPMTSTGP